MDERLQVRVLGTPEVSLDGQRVADLKLRKTQALLYLLAANSGPQRRSVLAGLLWGDLPEAAASANLRKSLFELRHALGPFLDIERETAALQRGEAVWVDHAEFLARADALAVRDVGQLEEAVCLYRGDFLAGFYVHNAPDFEHWVTAERTLLRELALGTLHALATRYAETGDLAHAIAHTRHALTLEPWREEVHCDLMRLLARDGQRGAALAQYEICRRALREELDIAPGPETEQVYTSIRDGKLEADAAHKGSAAAPAVIAPGELQRVRQPDNLPAQAIPCVGRSHEIAQLAGLLADPAVRLVTLTGAGGMGKTRLALAVAQQLLDDVAAPVAFRDGIFFVALAPLSAAAQLVPTIAATLSFRPGPVEGQGSAGEQLRDYLAGKQLLLVLDSFEQLAAEGAPWLADLLRAAPGVKALVTSREPLDLQGEQRFRVEGLPVPDLECVLPDQLLQEENAVTLFLQMARRVQYSFRLTDGNAPDVSRICRLVGGMPLAIQLAASWVALLSPAEIAAEIAADLYFLSTPQRDVAERHRSLRAVIEPSWQRLSSVDQDTFARLCLCRGGFTRADAQSWTGCGLVTLARLQQYAFLQYASESGRYQIHDVLRQYGARQLDADPERKADAQRNHSRYYCAWLAGRSGKINSGEQTTVLAAIDAEVENCRAAWTWAAGEGQIELLSPAVDALLFYFEYRGRFQEGLDACRIAIEQGALEATVEGEQLQVRLLVWQGAFSRSLGQLSEADRLLRSSLTRLEELAGQGHDVRSELAFTRLRMGDLTERRNPAEARVHFDMSQRLYRSVGDSWGAERALIGLGFGEAMENQLVAAADHYRQAIAILGTSGSPRVRIRALGRLAMVLACAGHIGEPEKCARESVSLARTLNDRGLLAQALEEQGVVAHHQGRFGEAQQWVEEGLALLQELGERYERPNAHLTLANILLHRGDWESCRVHIDQALALVPANQDHGYVLWAHYLLSAVALANHAYDLSLQHGLEAICMAQRTDFKFIRTSSHSAVGLAASFNGDQVQARQHLAESLLYVQKGTCLREAFPALLFAAFFLALQGDLIAAGRTYVALRHQRYIVDSVFCQEMAGRHLEALMERLTPEQLAAAEAPGEQLDLRTLATQMCDKLLGSEVCDTTPN